MEIVIAVVQMHDKKFARIGANAFDVLLVNEPSSSSRHEIRMELPHCHASPNDDPTEIALSFVQHYCRFHFFFLFFFFHFLYFLIFI
ncbi:unnamed protein product [Onchocerca flexuosa]|uniref:Uncharacterized protein n=1 Tax=Onchocerca flexuosa TaxID=387005 RepID=A0A183HRZ5_9BILA|nr:unnamed protein product [Onchocerca flexuosa]